ncbi:hypothetical protein [Streptococcus hyointestinalis]|uniref:hypothetical protein n=1 Tax=Streptococcus hyointestinalis TaxID=1337 RepID=UPI0013E09EC3|nr:hypothetical protein [Streptococcus hyointestinalis]
MTQKGSSGNSLRQTNNHDVQSKVHSSLPHEYSTENTNGEEDKSNGISAGAIEPATGKVLAMAGLKHEVGSSTATTDI